MYLNKDPKGKKRYSPRLTLTLDVFKFEKIANYIT